MKHLFLTCIAVILIFTFVSHIPIMSNNRCKRYILVHKDRIVMSKYGLIIPKTHFKYYTDITLRLTSNSDSTYQIIFWGDRNSWKWYFKTDKHFVIDVPYAKHKNKYNEMDGQILELIKSKLIPEPEIIKSKSPALKFV